MTIQDEIATYLQFKFAKARTEQSAAI